MPPKNSLTAPACRQRSSASWSSGSTGAIGSRRYTSTAGTPRSRAPRTPSSNSHSVPEAYGRPSSLRYSGNGSGVPILDHKITATMSHSDGRGRPSSIDACGVRVARIGAPAPGPSHATASNVTAPRSSGSYCSRSITACANPRSSRTSPGEERNTRTCRTRSS